MITHITHTVYTPSHTHQVYSMCVMCILVIYVYIITHTSVQYECKVYFEKSWIHYHTRHVYTSMCVMCISIICVCTSIIHVYTLQYVCDSTVCVR